MCRSLIPPFVALAVRPMSDPPPDCLHPYQLRQPGNLTARRCRFEPLERRVITAGGHLAKVYTYRNLLFVRRDGSVESFLPGRRVRIYLSAFATDKLSGIDRQLSWVPGDLDSGR